MKKLIFVTVALVLSVLMYATSNWFEEQTLVVRSINTQHLQEIERLKKIARINKWLKDSITPFLESLPKDANASDITLVKFFDRHANKFHFTVEDYIYREPYSHNLDVTFSVLRDDKKDLRDLMLLRYPTGYLQYDFFKLESRKVTGNIRIVQPLYGDANVSNR